MASAGDCKQTRIEMKHVLVAVIVIVSTLSFIASIVMITIGYLNPFGTVGLGILGGGCLLYFASVLFLCSSGIWVKNRYYSEENDYIEKVTLSSSEDISLLKPALNVTSHAKTEAGFINEMECELDNKMVPLCSVSTVFSSVSSSVSTVPDKMLFNWQAGEAEGTLDSDVFSSSLTAMQHTDMKLQERLKVKRGSTEQIICHPTSEWKIKDLENRKITNVPILYNNGKSVSDTPCQRKPVVMDFVGTTFSSAQEKQWMNHQISGQSKEVNIKTNPQICLKNKTSVMVCPVEGPLSSAAQSKHHHIIDLSKLRYKNEGTNPQPKKYNQESKPALEKRKIHTNEKDNQIPVRRWSVIPTHDSWIHNQGTSKGLNTVPIAIPQTEKKHKSCERLDKNSQERTNVPLQNLLPNVWMDQPEKVQLSSQMTTENLCTKGKVTIPARNEKIF